ncbi:MAG: hypothetical protein DMF76_18625 [Acidobacteria bacterium]|nr:MAG: hypothetical protein DMF76_18625 [Acidobacteriota bacterium]
MHFKPADSAFLHQTHFTLEFRPCDGWSKPPPAHHDLRVIGWSLKSALQLGNALGARHREREKNSDEQRN